MNRIKSIALIATSLAGISLCTSAHASVVTWELNSHAGLLGATQTYSVGPSAITITAAGFTDNTFAHTTRLYGKNNSGDEKGLGINSDPTGDHEIWGTTLIRIDMSSARSKGVTGFDFEFGSTTHGESWQIFGSNSATSGYVSVFTGHDEIEHDLTGLAGSYKYYYFDRVHHAHDGGDNVLLAFVGGVAAPVPEPSTWAMMLIGFAGLGFAGYKRARRRGIIA